MEHYDTPLDEYIELLQKHDWFFQYEKDATRYNAGRESWERICELQAELDPDRLIFIHYDRR